MYRGVNLNYEGSWHSIVDGKPSRQQAFRTCARESELMQTAGCFKKYLIEEHSSIHIPVCHNKILKKIYKYNDFEVFFFFFLNSSKLSHWLLFLYLALRKHRLWLFTLTLHFLSQHPLVVPGPFSQGLEL